MEETLLEIELIKAKEFLNIEEVAKLVNLSVSTLRRRLGTGTLKPIQKGKHYRMVFEKQSVLDWMSDGSR